MTKNQFLKEVSKIKGWVIIGETGYIRVRLSSCYYSSAPLDYDCPITAVANKRLGSRRYAQMDLAGQFLKLRPATVLQIMRAADGEGRNFKLRKQLLKATRLNGR